MGRLTTFIGSLPQHKPVSKGGKVAMAVVYQRFKTEMRKNMPRKASVADMIKSLNLRDLAWEEALISEFEGRLWDLKQAVDSGKIETFKGIGPANRKHLRNMLSDVEEPHDHRVSTGKTTAAIPHFGEAEAAPPTQSDLMDAIHAVVKQQASIIVEFQNAVDNFGEAVDILKKLALQQKAMWDESVQPQAPAQEATSKADAAGSNIAQALRTGQEIPPPDAQPLQEELFVPDGVYVAPSDTGFPAPDEDEKTGNFSPDRVPAPDEQETLRIGMWQTAHDRHWDKGVVKHMAAILGTGQNPLSLDAGTWNAVLTNLESRAAKQYWEAKYYKRYPNRKA